MDRFLFLIVFALSPIFSNLLYRGNKMMSSGFVPQPFTHTPRSEERARLRLPTGKRTGRRVRCRPRILLVNLCHRYAVYILPPSILGSSALYALLLSSLRVTRWRRCERSVKGPVTHLPPSYPSQP